MNRLVGAGIGLIFIIALILIVFGTKREHSDTSPEFKPIKGLISKGKLDEAKKLIDEIADKNPDLTELGKFYFDLADSYEKHEKIVKARDIYEIILSKYQNVENIFEIQERLSKLNIEILFSPIITDKDIFYTVEPGDTLSKIAKRFGTTVDLIKISNSLESDVIRAHSKLKVSNTKYKILVDKSQNLLTLLSNKGAVVKVYHVSTGENSSTPVGTFKIVNKLKDPVWYTQGAIVPAESPDNVLGSRWLGISERGYGIHGTVEPETIGRQMTKGCIRMTNSDVEELYTIVPIGTEVVIVD